MRLWLLFAPFALLLLDFSTQASDPEPATLLPNVLLQEMIRHAEADAERSVRDRRVLAQAAISPLDAIIDFVLAGAVPQIISHGQPVLRVPDFSFHINTSLGTAFKLVGEMHAEGGTLRDMKSLFRQGSAVMRRAAGGVSLLEAAAGIRLLRLSFSKYTFTLNGISASGLMQIDVSPAAMSIQLALVPPCTIQLRQLQVSQLGAVHVNITGLPGVFSGLPKTLETVLAYSMVRQEITSILVQRVSTIVVEELKRLSCK